MRDLTGLAAGALVWEFQELAASGANDETLDRYREEMIHRMNVKKSGLLKGIRKWSTDMNSPERVAWRSKVNPKPSKEEREELRKQYPAYKNRYIAPKE